MARGRALLLLLGRCGGSGHLRLQLLLLVQLAPVLRKRAEGQHSGMA